MYLCVDVGGTKTIIALLDNRGKILHDVTFPTDKNRDAFYSTLLQQIKANFCLDSIKKAAIALPGVIKNRKPFYFGNLPWKDFDIVKLLRQDLGITFVIENDANLAALGEASKLHGRSIYLTFSTGIGGGIVENGQLAKRFKDFEPGHTEYVFNGRRQEWEDIASGKAIHDHYGRYFSDIHDEDVVTEVAERIRLGLIPLCQSLKPDRVIFGGPVGLELARYRKILKQYLNQECDKTPRLQIARHGHYAVIHGCYLYAKNHHTNQ